MKNKRMVKKTTKTIAVATSALTVFSSLPTTVLAYQNASTTTTLLNQDKMLVARDVKGHIDRIHIDNLNVAQQKLKEANEFVYLANNKQKAAQEFLNKARDNEKNAAQKKIEAQQAVNDGNKAGEKAVQAIKDEANIKQHTAKEELAKARNKVAMAQKESKETYSEYEKALQKKVETERALNEAKRKDSLSGSKIEQLKKSKDQKKQLFDEAVRNSEHAQQAKQHAQSFLVEITSVLKKAEQNLEAINKKIQDATARLTAAEDYLQKAKAAYEKAVQDNQNPSVPIDNPALKSAEDEVIRLEDQVHQLTAKKEQLSETVRTLEKLLSENKVKLQEAQESEKNLKKKCDDAVADEEKIASRHKQIVEQLEEVEQQLAVLRQQKTDAQQRFDTAELLLNESNAKLAKLRTELQELQKQGVKVQEIEILQKQIKQVEAQRETAIQQHDNAEADAHRTIDEIKTIEQKRNQLEGVLGRSQKKLVDAGRVKEQLENDYNTAKAKVDYEQRDVSSNAQKLELNNKDLQRLIIEIENQNNLLSEAKEKVEQLKKTPYNSSTAITQLKQKWDDAKQEVQKYVSLLLELDTEKHKQEQEVFTVRNEAMQAQQEFAQRVANATDKQKKLSDATSAYREASEAYDKELAANTNIQKLTEEVQQAELRLAQANKAAFEKAKAEQFARQQEKRALDEFNAAHVMAQQAAQFKWKGSDTDLGNNYPEINKLVLSYRMSKQRLAAAHTTYEDAITKLEAARLEAQNARQYLVETLADLAWAQEQVNRLTPKSDPQHNVSSVKSSKNPGSSQKIQNQKATKHVPKHMASRKIQLAKQILPKTGDTSTRLAMTMSMVSIAAIASSVIARRKKDE